MTPAPLRVLTLVEAAALLRLHKTTLAGRAKSGLVPAAKVGRAWTFIEQETEAHLGPWHVQNGTPLDVLQKLGGWASYSMVLRYGHHSPGYLAGFANNTTKE